MAAQVELDTGRPGVGVGARLLLGPLASSSNTTLLGPEPGKPLPGPKPRLTPKPFAVDKNPTIRPILAPKPQPKPRPDTSRQPHSLKPDPSSIPKPPLVGGAASKPRPAPTTTQTSTNAITAAAKPAAGFQVTKPGLKPSTGQTSKPVAQPFKPAPPFTPSSPSSSSSSSSVSAEARKPLPTSQASRRPVGAAPAVPVKKPGIHAPPGARSSAEWSGSSRQKAPGPSTMTRAKSMGFLTDVGLTTEEDRGQRVGSTSSGAKGGVVAASSFAASSSSSATAVPLRPHGRAGTRPRPVSAIFLPGSTVPPDAQNSSGGGGGGGGSTAGGAGARWTGRRPLSADLTSKFEAAGFSVHQKAARMGSMENLSEQTRAENQNQKEEEEEKEEKAEWARAGGWVTEGRGREKEEKERRGSGDGKEDQSKASSSASFAAAQERVGDGRGTQEVGESREEVRGGGSIKRRISLLLDSSAATLTVPTAAAAAAAAASRTSADGVEARTAAQPITDADKAIGVKQRIRELSEDTPLSQSPPQRLGVKPRPLPRDFTKRFGSDKTLDVPTTPTDESKGPPQENDGGPLGKPGDAAPSAQTSVLQGDRKEAQQEVSDAADPSSPWRALEGGQRPVSGAHGTGPGVGVQTVRASLFENVVERHSVQMMMDDGWASTAGLAATAQGAARNRRPGRSISLRGRADLQGAPTSSISNNNNGDDDDDGSLVMAVYREPAPPSSPECVEHMFETVPGAGEKRAVSESVALAPLEERALTLRTRRSEGGAAAQRDLDLMSRPELGAQEGGPEWSGHRLGQEVALGTNGADEPSSTRYLRVGSLQGWGVVDATVRQGEPESGGRKSDMVRMMEEEIQRQLEIQRAAAAELEEEEEEEQVEEQQQHDVGRTHIMNPPQVATQREWGREMEREREDIAAPKRPKMLEGGEQPQLQQQQQQPVTKPRATYFALTGQIQESPSAYLAEAGAERTTLIGGGEGRVVSGNVPYEDFSLRSGRVDSQGKVIPLRRNPSLDAAFSKSPQQAEPQRPPGGESMRGGAAAKEMKSGEQSGDGGGRRDKRTMEEEAMEAERRLLQEFERKREAERERERQREAEQRRREAEREKEKQRELERQREAAKEAERQKELQRQKEAERQRELEKERQRKMEYEKRKAAEKELERQREAERHRQKEYEREKERMLDQERLRLREFERQKELERLKEVERQREIERQKQLELERQREIERLKQLEIERQKQLELERQREAERVKQLEIERQKALERERQRQKELERQREIERQKEVERRQKELERQREQDRQRDLERQRQLDLERQRELDRQRQKELEKQKEMEKQKAIERWKEAEKQKEIERERQRELDEYERLKELERQRLADFERKKERQQQAELKQQEQQQRRKERDESSDRRKQQELERQNKAVAAAEREKRSSESPMRPKVLDLDAVSLGDRSAPVRTPTTPPSARWRQPSARAEEPYRPAILDIDSFKSQQAQPAPPGEMFPVAGFQSLPEHSGTPVRSQGQPQPQTPEWARPQPSFPQQPTPMLQPPQQTQPLAPPQFQVPSAQPASLDWTRVPAAPHQQYPQSQAQQQPQFQPFTPDWTKISPPQPQPQPQQPTSQYSHHHHQTQPSPQYPPPYQHHHTQPLTPDWTKSQTSGQPLTPDWTKAQAPGQPLIADWTKPQTPGQPLTPDWTKAQTPGQPLMPSPLHNQLHQHQHQQQQPLPQSVNSDWVRPQPAPQSAPHSLPQPVASVIQTGNRASALSEPDWLAGPRSGTGAAVGNVAWPAAQTDVWQPRRDDVPSSEGSWFPADPSRRSGGGGGAVGAAKVGTDQAPPRPLIPSLPPPLIPLPAPAPAPAPTPSHNPATSLNSTLAPALNPNTGAYAAPMPPYTATPSPTQAPSQAPDRRWVAFPGDSDFAGALPTHSHSSHSAFGGQRHHGGQESGVTPGANMTAAAAAAAAAAAGGLTEPMAWERTAPVQRPEGRAARREPGQQDLSRMRSRSVSRRSAPCESSVDASTNRMRSRSSHRDKARQSWGEQLKQCVSGEQEPKDTDTLVQETDSQYGTWETGLRTEDSLTPATTT
ncbi:microtubule-associated protein futsch isoform X3 [Engraulis encrasicolus]|uniref:microtubule-associated protein futsch isoform X3 n=1 Tax=Engraulis encrasicolus TaxID=184585 RepID=UPI002FD3F4E0